MRTPTVLRLLAASVLSTLAACGGGASEDTMLQVGEQWYQTSCAACHGADLRGTAAGPSQLSIVYEPAHHPDESFRRAIREGVAAHHWDFGDMAPIPGLTDDQVTAIIAYVRSVQEREGFEPYPPE